MSPFWLAMNGRRQEGVRLTGGLTFRPTRLKLRLYTQRPVLRTAEFIVILQLGFGIAFDDPNFDHFRMFPLDERKAFPLVRLNFGYFENHSGKGEQFHRSGRGKNCLEPPHVAGRKIDLVGNALSEIKVYEAGMNEDLISDLIEEAVKKRMESEKRRLQ